MKPKKEIKVKAKNLGPINEVEFILKPGINVLRSRNGKGKTTILDAIEGGKGKVTVRRGEESGELTFDGNPIFRVKKVGRSGKADIEIASSSPLSTLIDPGVKDEAIAARMRIKALLELIPVPITRPIVRQLAGSDDLLNELNFEKLTQETVPDLADAIKRELDRVAREYESECDQAKGRLALLESVPVPEIQVDLTLTDAAESLKSAIAKGERLKIERRARVSLESQQAAIREVLKERPDSDTCLFECRQITVDIVEVEQEIVSLEKELFQAKELLARKKTALSAAEMRLSDIEKLQQQWDKQRAILDQPVEGPTENDLAMQDDCIRGAESDQEAAIATTRYLESQAEASAVRSRLEEQQDFATNAREAARSISERLGDILSKQGAKGFLVRDGRLLIKIGKETKDYAELSKGEKVRAIADVVARAYPDMVLTLGGDYSMSLDPGHFAEADAIFASRNLYVITEAPDANEELKIEEGR